MESVASRSLATIEASASMYSAAIHVCGTSPRWPGERGSRQVISGHWFHARGRRSDRKKSQQFVRVVALPETDEGADDADFIGGVVVPWHLAAVLAAEAVEIGVEHRVKRACGQRVREIQHGDGVGRGGGIEVRPLDRAGDVVEVFRRR